MLDKEKTYLVLNYCTSPVAVSTRHESYIIPAADRGEPSAQPFSIEEIIQINSGSPVFKIGLLWFEPEYEADIYDVLHIRDWKNLCKDSDFEEIVLHPTIDKLNRLLAIEDKIYFERAYGVYIGLKNASFPISKNVEVIMSARRKEFKNKKVKTGIVLEKKSTPVAIENEELIAEREKREALEKEIEEMRAMLNKMVEEVSSKSNATSDKPKKNSGATTKTATKKTTKKKSESNTKS